MSVIQQQKKFSSRTWSIFGFSLLIHVLMGVKLFYTPYKSEKIPSFHTLAQPIKVKMMMPSPKLPVKVSNLRSFDTKVSAPSNVAKPTNEEKSTVEKRVTAEKILPIMEAKQPPSESSSKTIREKPLENKKVESAKSNQIQGELSAVKVKTQTVESKSEVILPPAVEDTNTLEGKKEVRTGLDLGSSENVGTGSVRSAAQWVQAARFMSDVPAEYSDHVDLNTQEFKYISYFSKLKEAISGVWEYPALAVRANQSGNVLARFIIEPDGRLTLAEVVKSSGFPLLDDAVISALRKSSPFPPLPSEYGKESLKITVVFKYTLH